MNWPELFSLCSIWEDFCSEYFISLCIFTIISSRIWTQMLSEENSVQGSKCYLSHWYICTRIACACLVRSNVTYFFPLNQSMSGIQTSCQSLGKDSSIYKSWRKKAKMVRKTFFSSGLQGTMEWMFSPKWWKIKLFLRYRQQVLGEIK